MTQVSLPPGVDLRIKDAQVPAGQGHPENIPAQVRFFLKRCDIAVEQQSTARKQTVFKDAGELEWSCYQYFEWCENNPLYKLDTRFSGQHGRFYQAHVPQRRVYTVNALCVFLGISQTTWKNYEKDKELGPVVDMVNSMIFHHNFEGAAVDHFNAGIMTRFLGLADKQQVQVGTERPEEIEDDMTPEQAAEIYQREREAR